METITPYDALEELIDVPSSKFHMTDWEIDFVESLYWQRGSDKNWKPSEKQHQKMMDIYNRMANK